MPGNKAMDQFPAQKWDGLSSLLIGQAGKIVPYATSRRKSGHKVVLCEQG